jgi:hypothetical protein
MKVFYNNVFYVAKLKNALQGFMGSVKSRFENKEVTSFRNPK